MNGCYIPNRHKCPPFWETRIASNEDDWRKFRARDAEGAAIKAAEEYDQSDYVLLKGDVEIVEVRLYGDITSEFFEVSAEALPHYYANPIPDPEDD